MSLAEFTRVLVPGGTLITQQVGGRNLQSVFYAFGWGSNADQWGDVWPRTQRLEALVSTAPEVGLEVLQASRYQVEYAMADLDSLRLHAETCALSPSGFDPDAHVEAVNRLLRDSTGPHGVMSSERRQLFVAHEAFRRPDASRAPGHVTTRSRLNGTSAHERAFPAEGIGPAWDVEVAHHRDPLRLSGIAEASHERQRHGLEAQRTEAGHVTESNDGDVAATPQGVK